MAFHNPDPKMRYLEQRNAQARAAVFAMFYKRLGRGLRHVIRVLTRRRLPCGGNER